MLFLRLFLLIALVASMPIKLDGNTNKPIVLNRRSVWSSIVSLFNGGLESSPVAVSAASGATPTSATGNTIAAGADTVNTVYITTTIPSTPAAPVTPVPATSPSALAPAAVTTPVAATGASSGGWLSMLMGMFGSSETVLAPASPATMATSTTPVVPATSIPLATTPTAVSPIMTTPIAAGTLATGYFSSQIPTLPTSRGTNQYAGSSLSTSIGSSASASRDSPGFTGLVTVEAAGGTGTGTGPSDGTGGFSAGVASNSDIQKIGKYSEMGGGISYSPYTKDRQCKTAAEVKSDIQLLSGHTLIRLYSVDCNGIANVAAALSPSQKMFLGIWDITATDSDLSSMKQQVLTGSRGWNAVHSVAIGNEVVNAGTNTVDQVKTAVSNARAWFKANAADYKGYIVAVDTLAATMANPAMCNIGDYLAVNCHPYFAGIEASTSGTWLKQQIDGLSNLCGGSKKILITESGWPTQGNTEGQAVPSVANQLLAIKGLGSVLGSQVLMFTTYNDYWKAPGGWNVEQHWGIYGDPQF